MTDDPTPKRQLVDRAIQDFHRENLDTVVQRMRTHRKSWEAIARRITLMSNIDVTSETLRNWYPQYRDAPKI